jgi:hypothetical protein
MNVDAANALQMRCNYLVNHGRGSGPVLAIYPGPPVLAIYPGPPVLAIYPGPPALAIYPGPVLAYAGPIVLALHS